MYAPLNPIYPPYVFWAYSLSLGLSNLCFNVAHLELAWIYRKIARDTPKLIEDEAVDLDQE